MILLAILFPPIAVFASGKPIQGIFNLIIYFCAWIGLIFFIFPGVICWAIACAHACYVVNERKADMRAHKIADAVVASALIKHEEKALRNQAGN